MAAKKKRTLKKGTVVKKDQVVKKAKASKKAGATIKKAQLKPSSKRAAVASAYITKHGLPKGAVVKLLSKNKIDKKIIDKMATRLVPYMHT